MNNNPLVAILITGSFRTFDKCLPTIYDNIISKNNSIVFFLIEGVWGPRIIWDNINKFNINIGWVMSSESYRDHNFNMIVEMIKNSDRKSLNKESFEKALTQPNNTVNWPSFGPNFIYNTSGSILQWYHLWLIWQRVLIYERDNNVKFDSVIKIRTDCLIGKPIIVPTDNNFSLSSINPILKDLDINNLLSINNCHGEPNSSNDNKITLDIIDNNINDKIISFGVDIVIMASRNVFKVISNMVFYYGIYDSDCVIPFNSENCFHQFCVNNNIVHYTIIDKNFPLYTKDVNDKDKYIMIILRNH